ncbi:TRAP transporter small permease [Granulosicoccus antarcticus]|uniref:TRAP transporter small permease protein n=1 Tax=Granulosicoccus antarcticus IMCC3135 TaxID=1192854 RepID=A0A2Z2P0T8_9GAMM|nr:TRAP transporter small permease [Granulosicoccus antarcticus]ASJ73134.1 hypothetical protein IMCC3135_15250 [Granulosicoccus antarcticus IMCC3135]
MLQRIEKLLLELAVFAVLLLGILITTSVLLRVFFNSGVPDSVVMVRELMVAAIILPLAATSTARAHIVVEFLTNRFPVRIQGWFVVFGTAFGALALTPLVYASWNESLHTLQSGGFYFGQLNLPKWPGHLIFMLGISFCWLRLLLLLIGDVQRIRAGLTIEGLDAPNTEPSTDTGSIN